MNGDGVKKGSFHEPVTSVSCNDASEECICESKVVPSSTQQQVASGAGKGDEGYDGEEEGREMMNKVDNDQHHDSFKIEKDSSPLQKSPLSRVRTENFKKKVDSTSSIAEAVTKPSTVTTTTKTVPTSVFSVGSGVNTISSPPSETDVVTQLCFEPVEVLVKDLKPKEEEERECENFDNNIWSKQTPSKFSGKMNGCPNNKLCSTGAVVTGPNKSREDMRHAMKPSNPSSLCSKTSTAVSAASVTSPSSSSSSSVADHEMSGIKKSETSSTAFFKRSSSIKDLREKQNEAEVKIAREILELKQREEELRIMRQEMNRINTLRVKEDIKAVPSDVSSVEIDGRCSPSSSEISTTESISGRISVDSLESHSNCHSNTSNSSNDHLLHYHNHQNKVKRLSNMKVKPFEDKLDQECVSYFNQGMNSLMKKQESPIEREIRILKEREEELRLEKLKRCQGSGINNSYI